MPSTPPQNMGSSPHPVVGSGAVPAAETPTGSPKGRSVDVEWERQWQQIDTLANAWLSAAKDDGVLLKGDALKHARQWLSQGRGKHPAPKPLHREFIVAGARAKRGRILGISAISLLLVGGLGAGGWVLSQSDDDSTADDDGAAVATLDVGGGDGPTPKVDKGNRGASDAMAETAQGLLSLDPVVATLVATEAMAMLPSDDPALDAPAYSVFRDVVRSLPARPLRGGKSSVRGVALSPDGRWAISSDASGNMRLWDLDKPGVLKPSYLRGHLTPVTSMEVSRDGRWLITADADGLVFRWDLRERDPSTNATRLGAHRAAISGLQISDGSRWLATGDEAGEVKVWDLKSSSPTAIAMPSGHVGKVTGVAINADGSRVISSGEDMTTRSWRLSEGRPGRKPKTITYEDVTATSIAIAGDDSKALTGVSDGTVYLWDPASGVPTRKWEELHSHDQAVSLIEVTADSSLAVSAAEDHSMVVWDLKVKVPAASAVELPGHTDRIRELRLYSPPADVPDSRRFPAMAFSASDDGTVRSWNLDNRFSAIESKIFTGHDGAVRSVAVSGDGQWAITGGDDGVARVWDWQSLPAASTAEDAPKVGSASLVARGHAQAVAAVAVDRFGRRMITGSADGTARLWDLRNEARITSLPLKDLHKGPVRVATISQYSPWAVTGDDSGRVVLWDIREELKGLNLEGHTGEIRSIVFMPSGKRFVSASTDTTVRVWTVGKAIQESVVVLQHKDEVTDVDVSGNGRWLIVGTLTSVALWDLEGDLEKPSRTLKKHESDVLVVAADSKGHWVASGSSDRRAVLYDLSKDKLFTFSLRLHEKEVSALAFSPSGKWLATGSGDKSIRLWDLTSEHPDEGSWVLAKHEGTINHLQWSADGRWLASASNDGTIRLWDTSLDLVPMVEGHLRLEGHRANSVVRRIGLVPGKNERGITGVVSASYDGTARYWPLQASPLVKLGCSHAGRSLSSEEWAEYIGSPYKPSCG